MKKILFILAAVSALFVSCKVDEPPVNNTSVEEVLNTRGERILSYMEILEQFTTESGVYNPVRTRSGDKNLFTIDTIAYDINGDGIYNDDDAVYFLGRVVSDDFTGNVYKNLYLQDVLDPKHGVTVLLDASSLGGFYPMGQVILMRLNGLAIGKYANKYEIGVASYYSRTTETAMNAAQKVGWCVSRIPFNRFQRWSERIGLADRSKIVETEMTIPELRAEAATDLQGLCGRVVRIKNVHFTSEYYDYGKPKACTNGNPREDTNAAVFAPTTDYKNFSQSRIFKDDADNHLATSVSEFAKFAYYKLPAAEYKGDVVGIVGYYYDRADKDVDDSALTITIRGIGVDGSINDLQEFRNASGQLWIPEEWQAPAETTAQ